MDHSGILLTQAQETAAAGDLLAAAGLYRRVLKDQPDDFKALRGLSAVLAMQDAPKALKLSNQADSYEAEVLAKTATGLLDMGLEEKARALLLRAATLDQGRARVLDRLVQTQRSQGALSHAAAALEAWLQIDSSGPEKRFLADILAGRSPDREPTETDIWPVPFVHQAAFLSPRQRQDLMDTVLQQQASFRPSNIRLADGALADDAIRSSQVLVADEALQRWFAPLVLDLLPAVLPRLRVQPFPCDHTDLQITVSHGGDFYRPHRDGTARDDNYLRFRRVSFVYYFFRQPRAFEGGDLRLYDSDRAGRQQNLTRYTAIAPRDNSIVFFPSCHLHEVAPVQCGSDDFLDGRFTVNGWIYCPETPGGAGPDS